VVTLHTGGIPETIPASEPGREAITGMIVGRTMLGRAANLADVGNVAAFLASDRAGSITAASVNITCGAVAD
jgi:enoyl-[acyl-carrier-protein] reductase (NADH)